ncbi:YadA C-terminal domain-containing protein [Fusobacterium nucleatum]|uniref:YadA C-terminal domain-containing protein n=1 Tax=Fusobacterium nucleatum TaxID=851 RepID=UPI003D0809B5
MKNKFFNILLFIFLLSSFSIFSLDDNIIKEVSPIESIHSDEKNSFSSDIIDEEETSSQKSLPEYSILKNIENDYTSDELKSTNVMSTYEDLKTSQREESREDKFEEITDRTNRISALGSAMGAVDLSKTPYKKIRFGAGVGHSANNQAVAVGVGYAPTERLKLNTKISTTTNSNSSNRSNGISIGVSYDLDW